MSYLLAYAAEGNRQRRAVSSALSERLWRNLENHAVSVFHDHNVLSRRELSYFRHIICLHLAEDQVRTFKSFSKSGDKRVS